MQMKVSLVEQKCFDTFAHARVGLGHVTMALRVTGEDVVVGAAMCSPKEMFSKHQGRLRAVARLEHAPRFGGRTAKCQFSFKRDASKSLKRQALEVLVSEIKNNKTFFGLNQRGEPNVAPRWLMRGIYFA